MNNFLTIVKIKLLMQFNFFSSKRSSSDVNRGLKTFFIALLFTSFVIGVFIFQSYSLISSSLGTAFELVSIDSQLLLFITFGIIVSISTTMSSKDKDVDFLLSTPVEKETIVLSGIFSRFIITLVLFIVLYLPMIVIYIHLAKLNYIILLSACILTVILSIIFVSLECLFAAIIDFFIAKFRYYGLIKTMLNLLVVGGMISLYLYMLLSESNQRLPIVYILTDAVTDSAYTLLFLLVIISILIFIGAISIQSSMFGRKPISHKNKNTVVKSSNNSQFISLLKKEIRAYVSSSAYLLQTFIGILLIIGASASLFFLPQSITAIMEGTIFLVAAVIPSVSCTSASSISLEGKSIWILKSLPVKTSVIIFSKAFMNLLILFISFTISLIFCITSNAINLETAFLLYLQGILSSIFVSFAGVFINLLLPKFDYTSEMQVVKRSSSALISSFLPLLLFGIIPFSITLSTAYPIVAMDFYNGLQINIAISACSSIVIIILIAKFSTKLFARL